MKILKPRGFSLMEILIVIALLALMGVVLGTALTSSLDVRETVVEISERYQEIRQTMSRIQREISMAYLSKHRNAREPVVKIEFLGLKSDLTFVAFGNDYHFGDVRESDQRVIQYFIDKDKKTGKEALMRRVKPNPDIDIEKGGQVEMLCADVSKIEFTYWNQDRARWESRWSTGTASGYQNLPSRVRFKITAAVEGDEEKTFVTETKIWLTKPISII